MEISNIPIFRAKKIGLNNSYIIGFYQQYIEGFQDNIFHEINNTLIDPTTLAIHFPDMLDSQGNKIFASLSEDGKGGDIIESIYREELICIWSGFPVFRLEYKRIKNSKYDRVFNELMSDEMKVIGIQK